MIFAIHPYRRIPVQCSVTYNAGPFPVHGTVWNLSSTGRRLSGDLTMQQDEALSLTVTPPNESNGSQFQNSWFGGRQVWSVRWRIR